MSGYAITFLLFFFKPKKNKKTRSAPGAWLRDLDKNQQRRPRQAMSSYSGSPGDYDDYSKERESESDAARKRKARQDRDAFADQLSWFAEASWAAFCGYRLAIEGEPVFNSEGALTIPADKFAYISDNVPTIINCMNRARKALGQGSETDERAAVRAWCAELLASAPQFSKYPFDRMSYYSDGGSTTL